MNTFLVVVMMLIAFSMAMAFSHLLEMPARIQYDPELWYKVTYETGTYRFYGTGFGAWMEPLAILGTAVFCFYLKDGRAFCVASCCLVLAAHITWWLFVHPVNDIMVSAMPVDLSQFRKLVMRWEYAHAVRAVLLIGSLATFGAAMIKNNAMS